MERICIFDMFKIGVGPSSSHTMGPWRAAERFVAALDDRSGVRNIRVDLYGSLAKTGQGHGTDMAVQMGLCGTSPETIDPASISDTLAKILAENSLKLGGADAIAFDPATDIIFHKDITLPFHPNGLTFTAFGSTGEELLQETYFSIGGGFIVREGEEVGEAIVTLPCPIDTSAELLEWCHAHDAGVSGIVRENEAAWRTDAEIDAGLLHIWTTMRDCIWRGCGTEGILPGGLNVIRRAADMARELSDGEILSDPDAWEKSLVEPHASFEVILDWVSCFALAVNEENAAFGRVVTAPTNGAAGVIPSVMMYYRCFGDAQDTDLIRFLLIAGEIGSIFKKGATISAAMGGCQAEIGVSSAMAAAALTECRGGTPEQTLIAAEIAMEHHLGLTCDPIAGLVQVPCIERNAMGAIKAIAASALALRRKPEDVKVSLDDVVHTMWKTALDMNSKYKETSEGGLAAQISVNMSEC